jgi:hypothetical protein
VSISFRRFLSLGVIMISLSLGLGLTAGEWAQLTRQLDGAPLAIAPTQQAYLKGSNTEGGDRFGYTVAISGETLVVGALNEDSSASGIDGDQADDSAADAGAAYIFVRSGGSWSQQAYLKASNAEADDVFGTSVAISGDTVVVGAPGEDSQATGAGGDQADNSAQFAGAAYVFVRSGGRWSQQAYLKASNTGTGDGFGSAVAIAGDTIVVGAFGETSGATGVNGDQADNSTPQAGAAYVFVRSGSEWSQQAYLKASNTEAGAWFGYVVAVAEDTVVVGAPHEDSSATGVNGSPGETPVHTSGAAYVFGRSGGSWSQQAYLKASNPGVDDLFGSSVAIDGDTVVAGAPGEDSQATGVDGDQADNSAAWAGAAYIFVRSGGRWSQQAYLKASNTGAGDEFGYAAAINRDTAIIAGPGEASSATGVNGDQTDNSASRAGAAYAFARTGTAWSQQTYLKASNPGAGDFFGYVLALDGDTAILAAPAESSSATGVDGDQADNSTPQAGAAYVFTGLKKESRPSWFGYLPLILK